MFQQEVTITAPNGSHTALLLSLLKKPRLHPGDYCDFQRQKRQREKPV